MEDDPARTRRFDNRFNWGDQKTVKGSACWVGSGGMNQQLVLWLRGKSGMSVIVECLRTRQA